MEAIEDHPDLWQRYFDDFLLHKLRLGGLQEGAISLQILHVFFGQLHKQKAMLRVVSLHCYVHVYQLELARMANRLQPLNQIQQVCACLGSDKWRNRNKLVHCACRLVDWYGVSLSTPLLFLT